MCWNKGRLCWKIAKLFYFCHLKELVRPETFGPYYVCSNILPNVAFHLFGCGILCYCFVASDSRYKTRYGFELIHVPCSKTSHHIYCNTCILSSLHHCLCRRGWIGFIHGDINSHRRRRNISLKTKMVFCNRCFLQWVFVVVNMIHIVLCFLIFLTILVFPF